MVSVVDMVDENPLDLYVNTSLRMTRGIINEPTRIVARSDDAHKCHVN
jgi:hypothetical protein